MFLVILLAAEGWSNDLGYKIQSTIGRSKSEAREKNPNFLWIWKPINLSFLAANCHRCHRCHRLFRWKMWLSKQVAAKASAGALVSGDVIAIISQSPFHRILWHSFWRIPSDQHKQKHDINSNPQKDKEKSIVTRLSPFYSILGSDFASLSFLGVAES